MVLAWLALAFPLLGQYAGPAVLSRGQAPSAMTVPTISFRPFVNFSGTYSTGLAGVGVSEQGTLVDTSSTGAVLGWGVSGLHSWRHTKIGIDYGGNVSHYKRATAYDAVNQSLLLGITHQLTRHIAFSLRESAAISSRGYGLQGLELSVPFDPATTYAPTTDFFDNRTEYVSTQADLVIQRSPRLSFDLGGDAAKVWRRSKALYGVDVRGARGDVQYRLTRKSTIGATYRYNEHAYTRTFGSADIHSWAATYAIAFTRRLEFSSFFGASRVETQFIERVPIDPVIAAILGIASAAQVANTVRYVPYYDARLSRTFSNGVLYGSAGRAITAGNGLFTTSDSTAIRAGYSYTGLRYWSFSSNVQYHRSNALSLNRGHYGGFEGQLHASRHLVHSIHLVLTYSLRNYQSNDFDNYRRTVNVATLGFTFAPGDVPLRVW